MQVQTQIEMPPPEEIKAGVQVRVTDGVRMEKLMRVNKSMIEQTEKNKMSKIWEVDIPVTFVFKYKGEAWEMPVDRVHYFCTYWQEGTPKEWWISFRTPIEQ